MYNNNRVKVAKSQISGREGFNITGAETVEVITNIYLGQYTRLPNKLSGNIGAAVGAEESAGVSLVSELHLP